jgi:hypothetical protein
MKNGFIQFLNEVEYEILCFKKSSAGEYHRVKREIDEAFQL